MNTSKRFYIFWTVCIPVRLIVGALVLILTLGNMNRVAFNLLGAMTSIVATGFAMNVALTNAGWKSRGALGGRVWWARVRILHCILWGICATMCFLRIKGGGAVLLVDACIGIIFGILHFRFGFDV